MSSYDPRRDIEYDLTIRSSPSLGGWEPKPNPYSDNQRIGRGAWWALTLTLVVPGVFAAAIGGTLGWLAWAGLQTVVNVFRYHDLGKSGWAALIGWIPIVGFFWILVECGFLKGTPKHVCEERCG